MFFGNFHEITKIQKYSVSVVPDVVMLLRSNKQPASIIPGECISNIRLSENASNKK